MLGKLISLEGCEGSGKSTQLKLLGDYLKKNNIDFVLAREPGGTTVSEKIRTIILDKENKLLCAETESLLYAAARCQLLNEVVIPALKMGKIVVLDRYIDSSFAYQAYARELGYEFVAKANSFALENAMPDATLFFNLSPDKAFFRKGGAEQNDRIEQEGMKFHMAVYKGYLNLINKFPERFINIDADKSILEIHTNVIEGLKQKGLIK